MLKLLSTYTANVERRRSISKKANLSVTL